MSCHNENLKSSIPVSYMLQFYYRHHPTVHRLNPGAVRAVQVREESDALVILTRFGSDSDELIDTVLHPWINEGRKEGRQVPRCRCSLSICRVTEFPDILMPKVQFLEEGRFYSYGKRYFLARCLFEEPN